LATRFFLTGGAHRRRPKLTGAQPPTQWRRRRALRGTKKWSLFKKRSGRL